MEPATKRRPTPTHYKIAPGETISVLDNIPSSSEFYQSYIHRRKPVKFSGAIHETIDLNLFSRENIVKTLHYAEPLQVERKYRFGFGLGQERVKKTLEEVVEMFNEGKTEWYLTTQYNDEECDEAEDSASEGIGSGAEGSESDSQPNHPSSLSLQLNTFDSDSESELDLELQNIHDDYDDQLEACQRVRELFQPPLTNLVHHPSILPVVPSLFSSLVPQQINLWMGQASSAENIFQLDPTEPSLGLGKYIPGTGGTSSGLHHDHADNLYVLVNGRKRFTLFSPSDALTLNTVGDIYKIYSSGIIDYEVNENAPNWKHIRDDGALVEEIIHWKLEKNPGEETELLKELEAIRNRNKFSASQKNPSLADPPNFSIIPPGLLHLEEFKDLQVRQKLTDFAKKHFPGLLDLNRYTVWLNPQEMLYLPAGWFHEVSSFGSTSKTGNLDNVHIAVNYWFVPPTTSDPLKPYGDEYWYDDWERTKRCIETVRASS